MRYRYRYILSHTHTCTHTHTLIPRLTAAAQHAGDLLSRTLPPRIPPCVVCARACSMCVRRVFVIIDKKNCHHRTIVIIHKNCYHPQLLSSTKIMRGVARGGQSLEFRIWGQGFGVRDLPNHLLEDGALRGGACLFLIPYYLLLVTYYLLIITCYLLLITYQAGGG